MPAPYFQDLAAELVLTQQSLATATYDALFAYAPEARTKAATEASVLNKHLKTLLTDADAAAHQVTDYMLNTHVVTPLKASLELVKRLQRLPQAIAPQPPVLEMPQASDAHIPPALDFSRKICLGSNCPGGAACCGRKETAGALAS